MRSNPVTTLRRAVPAVLAAALLAPAAARAANRTFSANSLVIPVQLEYQSDQGILAAYGLVYTALAKNTLATLPSTCKKPIAFYWGIAPNKLSQYRCNTNTSALPDYSRINDNDGCDFTIQSADGVPVASLGADMTEHAPFYAWATAYSASTGPYRGSSVQLSSTSATPLHTVMKYLGGAFVVDATDRQCFIAMLQSIPELAQYHAAGNTSANYVRIHSAKASFTAPIARLLNNKPPLIAIGGDPAKQAFLENVITNAGLGDATTGLVSTGTVYVSNTDDVWFGSTATYPYGLINQSPGKYGLYWGADGMVNPLPPGEMTNFEFFLDSGYGAYVEANSIESIENSGTPLMTTTGVNPNTSNIAYVPDCNDASTNLVMFYANLTSKTACFTYGALEQPWSQTGNFPFQGGQADYKGVIPLGAFLAGTEQGVVSQQGTAAAITISAGRYKDDDVTKGMLIYLAGMRFDNGRFWGMRMIMNSVLSNVPTQTGVELARSEPVGYTGTTSSGTTQRVYQGTYVQMPDPLATSFVNYTTSAPQRWQFPWTAGHLYEYDLANIPAGSTTFSCTGTTTTACPRQNWDAALALPLPGRRQIFTALSGSAHIGWKIAPLDYTQTHSGCLDADGDGYCDLSEALAQCNTAGVITTNLQTSTSGDTTQADTLGMFVQQVRGYCSAHQPRVTGTPIMTPSDGQCDDYAKQKNRAILGGIDHGSPVIVGPSQNILDANLAKRPVVAYVGARDGMLHAFYVSGGSGFSSPGVTGPTGTTVVSGSLPGGVTGGTELWAFAPPGQLCGLATNNAMVDATLNVVDALAAFPTDANHDGVIDWTSAAERPTGKRTWRTILMASAGMGGSELFALDVTDPLSPVLLWHLSGASENDGRFDTDGNGVWTTFDKSNYLTWAPKWFDWDDGDPSTDYIPTNYVDAASSATYLDELKTGRYDYHNLGAALGTAVGKIGNGNSFQYVAYVATNIMDFSPSSSAPPGGFRGIEVFAIDLVTGQKLWQWEHRYTRKNAAYGTPIADNGIPGRVALVDVDNDGSLDRVYVGDLEGHLWELSATTGKNLNFYLVAGSTADDGYSLPLFGTQDMVAAGADSTTKNDYLVTPTQLAQQPLTTPISLGRFTVVPKGKDALLGRISLLQGAMGVDWSIAPFEQGSVYVVPVSPEWGLRTTSPITLSQLPNLRLYGVLQSGKAWRIALGVNERVFGMPRLVNNEVIFNTAFGSFSGNLSDTAWESGNLYRVSTDTTTQNVVTNVTSNQSKAFGGVLVFGSQLVIATDTSLSTVSDSNLSAGGSPANQMFDRYTPAIFRSWEPTEVGR